MNYSWLLYCAVSTVYINALLTNMCFEELKLLHRLIIFSCCTLFSFVLPQLNGTWGNIISFTFIFLFIVYLQKHPFLNAIGMLLNYIIGVTLNYLLLMFLYLVGVNSVSLYENIPYYFMFNIFQLCIMHPLTHAAGNFYRNLIRFGIQRPNSRRFIGNCRKAVGCLLFAFFGNEGPEDCEGTRISYL